MTVANQRAERGFTLVELLLGTVVAAIVCAGAFALLVSQQRAFRTSADDRALQEKVRSSLAEMGTNLRRAGYGVEPWLAFDFGPIANAPPSWPGAPIVTSGYPSGRPTGSAPGCGPSGSVATRDSTAGADDIVFYSRDPAFNRTLSAAPTTGQLRFGTPLKQPLYQGQILQVMCAAATMWAYVTVSATAAAGADRVNLTTCTSGFPHQQALMTQACLSTDWLNARVFKVDRFHYYVDRYADGATGTRPYLMLDRGLWDNATPLLEPVAPDVEDVQFAYVFPRSATQVVGGTAGTALSDDPASIDVAAAVPPAYSDLTSAPSRATNSPSNMRAVRVSVVVRTTSPDATFAGVGSTMPAAGNRPVTAGDANYRRILVETSEAIRNLDSRGPFFPAYSTNPADGLNVGGG